MFVILIKCYIKSNGSFVQTVRQVKGGNGSFLSISAIISAIMACDVQTSSSLAAMGIVEEVVRGCPGQSDTSKRVSLRKNKTSEKLIPKKNTPSSLPFLPKDLGANHPFFLLLPPMVPVFSVTFPGERRVTLCKLKCRAVWRFFALRLEGRICSGCNVTVGWLVGWKKAQVWFLMVQSIA